MEPTKRSSTAHFHPTSTAESVKGATLTDSAHVKSELADTEKAKSRIKGFWERGWTQPALLLFGSAAGLFIGIGITLGLVGVTPATFPLLGIALVFGIIGAGLLIYDYYQQRKATDELTQAEAAIANATTNQAALAALQQHPTAKPA